MSGYFKFTGTFPVKSGISNKDVLQVAQEACKTWMLDQCDFKIEPGPLRVARFRFSARTSASFAYEIVQTVQAWARRFADWPRNVLRYTITLDRQVKYCFYGPENRCIEANLNAIEKRLADLQEEWTELHYTQLPQASEECVELVERVEGEC